MSLDDREYYRAELRRRADPTPSSSSLVDQVIAATERQQRPPRWPWGAIAIGVGLAAVPWLWGYLALWH